MYKSRFLKGMILAAVMAFSAAAAEYRIFDKVPEKVIAAAKSAKTKAEEPTPEYIAKMLSLRPGAVRPADFDAYWESEIARLEKEIPLDAQVEPLPEFSKGDREAFAVSFATFGRRVYGVLTLPKDKSRKYPVQVEVPGAGNGGWVHSVAHRPGFICLKMSVHPWALTPKNPKETAPLYAKQDADAQARYGVKRYCQAGISAGREAYFYHPVILGINRAVNWLAAREEVEKGKFVYDGTSQGGGFGFYLLALNKNFTRGVMFVPALTDLLGDKAGRIPGWPKLIAAQKPENKATAEKWAPYFDAACFAPRIKVPVRVAVGMADKTCYHTAVFASYNCLTASPDKEILVCPLMPHGVFGGVYQELRDWLNQ